MLNPWSEEKRNTEEIIDERWMKMKEWRNARKKDGRMNK
jgi:hypothetical protein